MAVETNLTEVSDNDYISAVIQKADGSISHYARYKMDYPSPILMIGYPSDVDKETDSMYVFYENYRGEYSGSISDPVKICFEHELEYTSADDEYHEATCKNCSFWMKANHNITYYDKDADTHTKKCEKCGYERRYI